MHVFAGEKDGGMHWARRRAQACTHAAPPIAPIFHPNTCTQMLLDEGLIEQMGMSHQVASAGAGGSLPGPSKTENSCTTHLHTLTPHTRHCHRHANPRTQPLPQGLEAACEAYAADGGDLIDALLPPRTDCAPEPAAQLVGETLGLYSTDHFVYRRGGRRRGLRAASDGVRHGLSPPSSPRACAHKKAHTCVHAALSDAKDAKGSAPCCNPPGASTSTSAGQRLRLWQPLGAHQRLRAGPCG